LGSPRDQACDPTRFFVVGFGLSDPFWPDVLAIFAHWTSFAAALAGHDEVLAALFTQRHGAQIVVRRP
jgi:hypothetical protein